MKWQNWRSSYSDVDTRHLYVRAATFPCGMQHTMVVVLLCKYWKSFIGYESFIFRSVLAHILSNGMSNHGSLSLHFIISFLSVRSDILIADTRGSILFPHPPEANSSKMFVLVCCNIFVST